MKRWRRRYQEPQMHTWKCVGIVQRIGTNKQKDTMNKSKKKVKKQREQVKQSFNQQKKCKERKMRERK